MAKKSKKPEEASRSTAEPSMPHDGVFKKCMSDLAVATDFLRAHLPAAIQQQLDFSTLSISSESYVDEDIKQYCSDIVYSLKTINGRDCYIYCLVEHQSTDDPLMPFRLMHYCLAVMQRHIDGCKTKTLPLVVPVLFYHGVKRPYPHTHKMRFVDCFENVELAERLYHNPLPLVDITIVPDEEILTHKGVALLEAVQKHIQVRDDLLEVAPLLANALLVSKPSRALFRTLMYYINKVGEVSDKKRFLEDITQAGQDYREEAMTIAQQFRQEGLEQGLRQGREEAMTIAQQFRQEGRQEGLEQGREDERVAIAKKMLAIGVDQRTIKNCTGLSDQEMSRLHLH